MQMDWGVGHYESTAEQLSPVATAVVERAAIQPRDRVVDVGCGTGNASLAAAAKGAHVTGVDPAERLLEVARGRAAESGADATFVRGDAAALRVPGASADVVLSVFAVIFAPDAAAAAAEMARVTALGGRILLTAWLPEGAIHDFVGLFQGAIAAALGMPPRPPGFAWHDQAALASLFGPHGFSVTTHTDRVPFTAASAQEYMDIQRRDHPMSIAGQAVLESRGGGEEIAKKGLAILERANEDPSAFRVTSRYLVATAVRSA